MKEIRDLVDDKKPICVIIDRLFLFFHLNYNFAINLINGSWCQFELRFSKLFSNIYDFYCHCHFKNVNIGLIY